MPHLEIVYGFSYLWGFSCAIKLKTLSLDKTRLCFSKSQIFEIPLVITFMTDSELKHIKTAKQSEKL